MEVIRIFGGQTSSADRFAEILRKVEAEVAESYKLLTAMKGKSLPQMNDVYCTIEDKMALLLKLGLIDLNQHKVIMSGLQEIYTQNGLILTRR